eukprot:CAMPEP_0172698586 /NCGR_PEP_ID=MMETSP1074-20121228/29588_1 /TAXON_ID=2916 /ORGANISM="Ceratium fusus, Strain PA161109" /LENGTH=87 /DNA_ID=CAMNT_0013519657 /DNA_START=330 /DNA_END=593 /DNA_ORIENTATION=+
MADHEITHAFVPASKQVFPGARNPALVGLAVQATLGDPLLCTTNSLRQLWILDQAASGSRPGTEPVCCRLLTACGNCRARQRGSERV